MKLDAKESRFNLEVLSSSGDPILDVTAYKITVPFPAHGLAHAEVNPNMMNYFFLQSKLKNKDLERFFRSVICQLFTFHRGAVSEAVQ